MAVTEVKKRKSSPLAGIVLFIAGTCLLWWNEGDAKKTSDMLEDAAKECITIDAKTLQDSNNGKLVWAADSAITNEVLVDNMFDISVNAIYLARDVEYYQWVQKESTRTEGDKEITTYTYETKWVDEPVNSDSFKEAGHTNMVKMLVDDNYSYAQKVRFGAYTLSESLIRSIGNDQPYEYKMSDNVRNSIGKRFVENHWGNDLKPAQVDSIIAQYIHQGGSECYIGANSNSPQVGDVRITMSFVGPRQSVSVISQVSGETFTPWQHKNGKTFERLNMGTQSKEIMFQQAEDEANFMKWFWRVLGTLVVIWGLQAFFEPLSLLLYKIPWAGNFLGGVTGTITKWIARILGLIWSLLVIAIAWLFARPLLSILILVVIGGLIFLIVRAAKKKKAEQAGMPQPMMPGQPQMAPMKAQVPPMDQMPPHMTPQYPPQMPPQYPPQTPPMNPQMPPMDQMPPQVPPQYPPQMPPQYPPQVPPQYPPQIPPQQ